MDWANREYVPGLAALKNGSGELREYEDIGGLHDSTIWKLVAVAYGDYDGDGTEEAAVLLSEKWYGPRGGHREQTELYVYELVAGKPAQLGRTATVSGSEVSVEQGRVVVRGGDECREWRLQGRDWKPAEKGCRD